MAELNALESENIGRGLLWARMEGFEANELLDQNVLSDIHQRMFEDVWQWAGQIRPAPASPSGPTRGPVGRTCYRFVQQRLASSSGIVIRGESPGIGTRHRFESLLDQVHSFGHRDVLPHPDYGPTGLTQSRIVRAISLHVAFKLRSPVVGVAPGRRRVLGARVPEASIHEYRDLGAREHHVWPHPCVSKVELVVLAEP